MKRDESPRYKMEKIGGSFRDPAGFVYFFQGGLYRQVNHVWKENYDFLMESGLYGRLVEKGLLVPHEEVMGREEQNEKAYKRLKPVIIPFISYPYEWCFGQLKDAALATLKIQKLALNYGMSLTDGSAYNIQFWHGKPILIDILSFERYREGKPWVAYRQFCQFFLAPLALMSYRNILLNKLLLNFIAGIPLELASELLPWRSWVRLGLFLHLHLPRSIQRQTSEQSIEKYVKNPKKNFSKKSFLGLIDNLYATIEKLKWVPKRSEWSDYYSSDLYSSEYVDHKKSTLEKYVEMANPGSIWDLGANTGLYSRICADKGIFTVSLDGDPLCVEKSYQEAKKQGEKNILPLQVDLTNPSPALGWMHQERFSLVERGPVDMLVALALLHHLAISNNLPFEKIAEFFHRCSRWAVMEFVPKDDPQVQKLLRFREDIFEKYSQAHFEKTFSRFFKIVQSTQLHDSRRTLYLLESLT